MKAYNMGGFWFIPKGQIKNRGEKNGKKFQNKKSGTRIQQESNPRDIWFKQTNIKKNCKNKARLLFICIPEIEIVKRKKR